MGRSLALALYLVAAARGGAGVAPDRPARPDGTLVWLHVGAGATFASVRHLVSQLARERPHLRYLVTGEAEAAAAAGDLPAGVMADLLPPDRIAKMRSFLGHWRPDMAVFLGASLPPAAIVETNERHIPLVMADVRLTGAETINWIGRRSMAASLLGRFERVLAADPDTVSRLRAFGAKNLVIEMAGRIEETSEPMRHNESERAALAELLQARPVWYAVACPESEEEAVVAAQAQAVRLAHRMLLIVTPADPARGGALADRLAAEGWVTALRSREEEPDPEVQIFIADGDGEHGLWYRLAPVTYMGGTLGAGGSGRNPFEPAALGSAILHGPHPGPYPDAYARLEGARAARKVDTAEALAEAVADLIAPDKAALLAHNAWATSSGGAEVTERVAQALLAVLDARPGKAAA